MLTLNPYFIAIHLLIYIVGLFSNLFLCYSILRQKRQRCTTALILINLSLCHMIWCIANFVVWVQQHLFKDWILGELMCGLLFTICTTCYTFAFLALPALATLRCYCAFQKKSSPGRWTSFTLLITLWTIAFIAAIPTGIFSKVTTSILTEATECNIHWPGSDLGDIYLIISFPVLYSVSCTICIVCSVSNYCFQQCWSTRAKPDLKYRNRPSPSTATRDNNEILQQLYHSGSQAAPESTVNAHIYNHRPMENGIYMPAHRFRVTHSHVVMKWSQVKSDRFDQRRETALFVLHFLSWLPSIALCIAIFFKETHFLWWPKYYWMHDVTDLIACSSILYAPILWLMNIKSCIEYCRESTIRLKSITQFRSINMNASNNVRASETVNMATLNI